MDITLAEAAYAAAVLFCAYIVRGNAGFGSGLIAVPLLALQFPIKAVVPIVVLLDYLGSASQGLRNRDSIACASSFRSSPSRWSASRSASRSSRRWRATRSRWRSACS